MHSALWNFLMVSNFAYASLHFLEVHIIADKWYSDSISANKSLSIE